MISPTGMGPRADDPWGSGKFGAPRSSGGRRYAHQGLDVECRPGNPVTAPVTGILVREARPYAGPYSGVLIDAGWCRVKLFYFEPDRSLFGTLVQQGQVLGVAQDVATPRYPGMTPHIHTEIRGADNELINPSGLIVFPA